MSDEERVQGLEADVDMRLFELWTVDDLHGVLGETPALLDLFGTFMRAAYAKGYTDALNEVREGRGGELHRAHGYTTP